MRAARLVSVLVAISVTPAFAKTIHVPKDQPTIQDGINAAQNGDVVLVAPGTYKENINFNGKAIKVETSNGPEVTTIDGGGVAPVVVFVTNEGADSILSGFTLRNGEAVSSYGYNGGGIHIGDTSPTVRGNLIEDNSAGNFGGGIGIDSGSPLIKGNIIRKNSASFGGGLSVSSDASSRALITGNIVCSNVGYSDGGGILLFNAGEPRIKNNIIRFNSAAGGQGEGGGLWVVNSFTGVIVQNLFYGNIGAQGGGINLSVPCCDQASVLVNNTVIGGSGQSEGSAVWVGGYDNKVRFFNNLMIGLSGQNAVYCDGTYTQPPKFRNNDAYSPKGTGLEGACAGENRQNGDISANPKFVNPTKRNYELATGSPAINAGTTSAPDLPKKDLAGHPRIVDGKIDMGAYEHQGK